MSLDPRHKRAEYDDAYNVVIRDTVASPPGSARMSRHASDAATGSESPATRRNAQDPLRQEWRVIDEGRVTRAAQPSIGRSFLKQRSRGAARASTEVGAPANNAHAIASERGADARSLWSAVCGTCSRFINLLTRPLRFPRLQERSLRSRSRTLAFLFDSLRFGVTFAAIFLALFVAINYQSLWQITAAELALGGDSATERGLNDLTMAAARGTTATAVSRVLPSLIDVLPAVGPFQNRLIIAKIGKNVPIVTPRMDALVAENWKQFEDDIQLALRDGVVYYPGSAEPGQAGNFFLTGHSSYYFWVKSKYRDVFAKLSFLDVGDVYSVYFGGDLHSYRVIAKREVRPTDVSVLDQPSDKRLSTLMTCTPVGTTLKRLVIQGEEIDPRTAVALKVGQRSSVEVPKLVKLETLPI